MRGKIIDCINHGSIVQILIRNKEEGLESIIMDHRCFWNMVEVKQDIKGKEVEYNEEDKTILFAEDLLR